MSKWTTVRLRSDTWHQVKELASHIEGVTGVRPTTSTLLDRCITDGAEAMRRRPALAIDATPRKGDT